MSTAYYAVASGHDATTLTRFTTLYRLPPTVINGGQPVPTLGPVRRVALSGRTTFNGNLTALLYWGPAYKTGFADIIAATLGSLYQTDKAVTLVLRNEAWEWMTYNAYLSKPQVGENFEYRLGGNVSGLGIPVNILAPTVATFTSNTTLTSSQRHVRGDTSSGNVTLTLPAASGTTNVMFHIRKTSASNTLTVQGGAINEALTALDATLMAYSDGANWWRVNA